MSKENVIYIEKYLEKKLDKTLDKFASQEEFRIFGGTAGGGKTFLYDLLVKGMIDFPVNPWADFSLEDIEEEKPELPHPADNNCRCILTERDRGIVPELRVDYKGVDWAKDVDFSAGDYREDKIPDGFLDKYSDYITRHLYGRFDDKKEK
jgi:hypothetical protein